MAPGWQSDLSEARCFCQGVPEEVGDAEWAGCQVQRSSLGALSSLLVQPKRAGEPGYPVRFFDSDLDATSAYFPRETETVRKNI